MSRRTAMGLRLLAALLAALLAQGCVTTTTSSFKADKQAEVKYRVEAATAYLKQGNNEQAIVHLRRALEVEPNDASIHDTLAQVFWKTGEYELCEEHFRRAIALDPKFSRARNNYAAFLYERGDARGAIKELELVVADTLYDGRSGAYANLGRAYLKTGETAKAEEALTRAVKMDGRQWPALLELAAINFERGESQAAARYYEQFRGIVPRQTPRSLLLGIRLAQAAGNRDDEASFALQLKSMYPNSEEYREFSRTSGGR
jgi:type IV pilus assembly protein PilF